MHQRFKVTTEDANRVRAYVVSHLDDSFVLDRIATNVDGPGPTFDHERFWFVMLGCLLTTQQRSTFGAPVNRFLDLKPFPLSHRQCTTNLEQTVIDTLTRFGGIRMAPTIAKRAHLNYSWLESGGWDEVQKQFTELSKQRGRAPLVSDIAAERKAARFAAHHFKGIGPKQSRNLWQWLGLTRYEIPFDSRICKWINQNMSFQVETLSLAAPVYYDLLLDHVQALCRHAGVLPCVFDAAAFDYGEGVER